MSWIDLHDGFAPAAEKMTDSLPRTLALTFIGCVTLMPLLILPVMVGGFVDYLALPEDQAGWLASAGFLGAALSAVLLAFRMHRLDLVRLALLSLLLMACADGLSALAQTLPWQLLTLLRFVSGFAGGLAYGAVMGSYASWKEPDRAYGLFMAMQFAVSAAGLYLLPIWLPVIGVKGLFMGLAVLALMAVTLVGHMAGSEDRQRHIKVGSVEWQIIFSWTALACLLGIGLFETANMGHFTYIERIGLSFGLTGQQVGSALAVASLVGVPAAFSVTLMGSRFGYYLPLLAAVLIQLVSVFLLMSDFGPQYYLAAVILMSIGWATSLPYFQAILAGLDKGGSVVVAGGFATGAGGFLGPAGAAALVGDGQYGRVMIAIALCLVLSNLAARLVTLRLRQGLTPS